MLLTAEAIGWIIAAVVVVSVSLIAFIKYNRQICEPNEVLILSGRSRKTKDGRDVGYRLIVGGHAFRWPILETVSRMKLTTMPIDIEVPDALAAGLIPLNIHVIAHVKIAGSEAAGLGNAIERLLGLRREQVVELAREALEGSVRGVLATMAPEEANADRLGFAAKVNEVASADLQRLGLVLDTFKVQSLSDCFGYLEAVGRQKNAEVRSAAAIAEANADKAARMVAAEAGREAAVAEAKSKVEVVEAQNALRVREAELAAEANKHEERARVAGEIERAIEETRREKEQVERNKLKYQAEVVIPAEARKTADELEAVGRAARLREEGRATAEAMSLMREEWDEGKTKDLFLIQQLPDIVDKFAGVIKDNLSIERLTVVDSGAGNGVPNYVRNATGSIAALMDQVRGATGLDIRGILESKTGKADPSGGTLPKELT